MQNILYILQNSLESETLVPNKTRLKPSFPSFARTLLFISIIISIFIGCGSENNNIEKDDVVLKKGESIICTNSTKFSIEPTAKPAVSFSKNIENGDVTISLNKKSRGFVTIVGCTKK